jgi:hypothetical protein
MTHTAMMVTQLWKMLRVTEIRTSLTAVVGALVPMLLVVIYGKKAKALERVEQMEPERR